MTYTEIYKVKFEFYTQGPDEKQAKQSNIKWKDKINLPPKGLSSTKKEIDTYISADPDIIKLNLKIGDQKEKIEFIEDILKMIHFRSNQIKNYIEWEKFKNGA